MTEWTDCLSFFKSPEFLAISSKIEQEIQQGKNILPPPEDILNALAYTRPEDTRVVILGQDPYHSLTPEGNPIAHGLAFSVQEGTRLPPSLQNIYKEMKSDLQIDPPNSGCLTPWAKQGVLLLNSALTVEQGLAGSHAGWGWEGLTKEILGYLSTTYEHIVFILWGQHAIGKQAYIRNKTRHLILTASHPSPYSANNGFFGSKPFSKTNSYLTKHGFAPIAWNWETSNGN